MMLVAQCQATDELLGLDASGSPKFSPAMTAVLADVTHSKTVVCIDAATHLDQVSFRSLQHTHLQAHALNCCCEHFQAALPDR